MPGAAEPALEPSGAAAPEPALEPASAAQPEPFSEPAENQAPGSEYLATRLEPAVAPPPAPEPFVPPLPGPGGLGGGLDSPVPGLPGDEVPGHGVERPGTEAQGLQYPDTEAQGAQYPGPGDLPTEMPAELPSSIPPAIVEGIFCANGHFNDPQARDCAVCGIGLSPSASRQQGMRPPLGALILDDGSMCQLDADCIIGREPTLDSAVAEGRARPLRVTDASGVVSRMHARVELEGWQAFITDLHSANGTQILRPGDRHPTSLAARHAGPAARRHADPPGW